MRTQRWLTSLKSLLPVIRIALFIFVFINLSAMLVLLFEGERNETQFQNFGDALWWAIVTMTTVGYGDKYPVTQAGRAVAVILMYSSIVLISLLTATASSIYVARRIQESRGLETVKYDDHILVCGWNKDAPKVLEALNNTGPLQVVLVNEAPPETMDTHLNAYPNLEIRFVRGNFAQEVVLQRASVISARAVVILPDASLSAGHLNPDDMRTIEATVTIKDMAPDVKVYAHVMDADRVPNLRRANIDDVVISDEYTGQLLAGHVTAPGTPQVVQELFAPSKTRRMQRVPIPDAFIGKPVDDLFMYFRNEQNAILLGLVTEDEGFQLEDALAGGNDAIIDFIKRQVEQAGISTATKGGIQVNLNPPGTHIVEKGALAIVIQ